MDKFMQAAIDEAREGMEHNHGGPFGAIIVRDGKIVSRSHNEVLLTNDPTAHAEVLAIRKASEILENFDLSDCEIYTSSQPCPMCLAAIYWSRIKKVYFGTNKEDVAVIGFDDSRFYKLIRGEEDKNPLEIVNIDRKECLGLLREWEEKSDKKMY
ncbi:nucleoside deaminase [Methanolobus sediminis]|uniref:Nucleoside deaminase n=1 Tax=Methanolobus sediminis TaxID=3072978 RepID=A0AA51UJS9_9EURY|nr:nucleoside deaminase [Methanolobus sediminis]WMW24861.1 nucleoside deaminase [Methanolobus sediminis]